MRHITFRRSWSRNGATKSRPPAMVSTGHAADYDDNGALLRQGLDGPAGLDLKMPKKVIYQAQIDYIQILDEQGRLDEELARDTLSPQDVMALYELMILSRELDQTAFNLQRSGRMGTYPPNKGTEAVSLGAVRALRKDTDYLIPSYRENAAMILHGMPLHLAYLFWMGDERGNKLPDEVQSHPMCLEVGAQCLHAMGIAWAFKLRKEPRVALCFLGDGATSTGDFHEAMNFASVMHVPLIFSCINNGWAISLPSAGQTASRTLAQKALAYGMPTVQVDGNDLFAVYKVHHEAAERARAGEGPSFIESITYRLGDHTTADDARRYREAADLAQWEAKDPMIRIRKYLEKNGLWNDQRQKQAEQRAHEPVREVTRQASEIEPAMPGDMFDYVYGQLSAQLIKQRDTLRTDSIGQDPQQIGLRRVPATPPVL
jgi:pyruvate dehydrogenase E1 component alpha subunit